MFSGIIKSVGTVTSVTENGSTKRLIISSPMSSSLNIDQSISHDGVCLTVVEVTADTHAVEVIKETLSKTNMESVVAGKQINLEKSITTETLLDGHLVQGHIDTRLRCTQIEDEHGSWKVYIELPRDYAPLVIPHGSICINGVSLTIADLGKDYLAVAIIPYTQFNTNFQFLKAGDYVNVEFDVLGKYFVRLMELRELTE
ncbi:MAG: riboflavin synthase [Bacteroidota bacterium]|nr:riboflavin synthase [Bacteroidota bacterium]